MDRGDVVDLEEVDHGEVEGVEDFKWCREFGGGYGKRRWVFRLSFARCFCATLSLSCLRIMHRALYNEGVYSGRD